MRQKLILVLVAITVLSVAAVAVGPAPVLVLAGAALGLRLLVLPKRQRRRRRRRGFWGWLSRRVRMRSRAARHYNPPDWSERRKVVLTRDGHQCTRCGRKKNLQVHHRKPRARKPDHSVANLETLCVYCHASMGGPGHGRSLITAEARRVARRHGFRRVVQDSESRCNGCRTVLPAKDRIYVRGWIFPRTACERCLLELD